MVDSSEERAIHRVLAAIEAIKAGGMVIMTDDEKRENEGDLIFAAAHTCPSKVNFMAKEARGLICLTLEPSIVERLQLPLMGDHNKHRTPMQTAFTVSIEAKEGVSTGISAADRAHTIRVAIAEGTLPQDLVVPGHVFPLKAKKGGVLERAGHTEGSVDLVRLAGLTPAAVICEIMNDDGTMARLPDLEKFAQKHTIPLVSIEDLITFRLLKDSLVAEVGRRPFATPYGTFTGVWLRNLVDQQLHFALVKGEHLEDHSVHVRVHKQQPLSDVFGPVPDLGEDESSRWQLDYSMKMLAEHDHAVVVYLFQENSSEAMQASLEGLSSPMDPRLYGIGAQILKSLGVKKMRLHVRSQRPLVGLGGFGLEIAAMEVIAREKPNSNVGKRV